MAKDQRKRQKQKQRKAPKHKAKKDLHKNRERLKAQNNPDIIIDKVDFALELAEEGEFLGAFQIINKLKKKHPANPDVLFGLGVLAMYSDGFNEAIEHFDRAIEIDPLYIKTHFNRAVAYHQLADVKRTIESLKNVIELRNIDSDLADQAQERLDNLSVAIGCNGGVTLDRFIEAQTNFEIGLDYMEKQDFKNAISPLKKALSINPDPPQIYGNLGLCYACLGEKQIALDYLDKALELDPKYEVALVNRSLVEKLETGEKLDLHRIKAVNYYLDYLKPKE